MPKMEDCIRPHIFVALRLPSGTHKVTQLEPNTTVTLGKYGTFNANDLLGRPFYHTYEILDKSSDDSKPKGLRIVPASELVEQDVVPETDLSGDQPEREDNDKPKDEFEIVDQAGKVLMRTNRDISDQAGAQKLTAAEIEELKKAESASGRDIIAKIMESHSEIDKKTAFSLAKYTTRKASKYLRRFVPIPMDVSMLAHWWLYEKDPSKIMELREEMLSLVMSWSNVHFTQNLQDVLPGSSRGRWLVVDDTGGLVVAAMAERLGILYQVDETVETKSTDGEQRQNPNKTNGEDGPDSAPKAGPNTIRISTQESHMSATENTIHLVHANAQPNIAMLSYFSYDPSGSTTSHPLHRHLKTLTWLQLLQPEDDPLYAEPEYVNPDDLATWKSNKRGTYYRKRRRWQRTKAVVDEARAGEFDGLIICSTMAPQSPVRHLVPLLRGGAPVVIYSPTIEPLAELADFYSTARRSAFQNMSDDEKKAALDEGETGDFPVNPALLLSPSVFTSRARPWQVLPGRTHPMMTGLGGAQGYLFAATRVIPIEGEKVEARGVFKRRKTNKKEEMATNATSTPVTE